MDRQINKPICSRRRLAIIVMSAVFVVVLVVAATSGSGGRRLRVPAGRIQIDEVIYGAFEEYVPASGEVVPIRTVFLDAVEGGRVDELFVVEGAMVQAGERLLSLSNTKLLLDIMYREAELFQQRNNLRNSELALEQYRLQMQRQILEMEFAIREKERAFKAQTGLANAGLNPRIDLEKAQDDVSYAKQLLSMTIKANEQEKAFREQQVEQLRSSMLRIADNLELAKSNLDDLIIRAPVTGHLTSFDAEIGETKSHGQRLGKIDVLDGFKVRVLIDQHYIHRLVKGQEASLNHEGQEFVLVVDKISPEVVEGRCEVDLLFPGAEPEGIRRGQTLHLKLRFGDSKQKVLLPRGGFYQQTGGRWAFVVDASGKTAHRQEITLGLSNPRYFEVIDGITQGQWVVVSSYEGYQDIDELVIE